MARSKREEGSHDHEYHRPSPRRVRGAGFRRLCQLHAVLLLREWRTGGGDCRRDGDGYFIKPLFVSVTPSVTLTDHDGEPAAERPP